MRTYGDWLNDKLHTTKVEKKELARRANVSYSFIADLCRDRETPMGNVKLPSRENAVAIAEALNSDRACLADDINESLVMAGFRPQSPATITFDANGNPIVMRADKELERAPVDTVSIHERLDQQQRTLEQILAKVSELRGSEA